MTVAVLAASLAAESLAGPPGQSAAVRVGFSEFAGLRGLRERPTRIHGGSDFRWVRLTWQSWGGRVARGSGFFEMPDKTTVPFSQVRYPVRLTLWGVRRCLGRLYYSRMTSVFTGERPSGAPGSETIHYSCPVPDRFAIVHSSGYGKAYLGPYQPFQNPLRSDAERFFGPANVLRPIAPEACVGYWFAVGVRITFANFGLGSACSESVGSAQQFEIGGLRGRFWRTLRGLRVGHSLATLQRLYPAATRHGRVWWLVTGTSPFSSGARFGHMTALVSGNRVVRLRVWVGAAGD